MMYSNNIINIFRKGVKSMGKINLKLFGSFVTAVITDKKTSLTLVSVCNTCFARSTCAT